MPGEPAPIGRPTPTPAPAPRPAPAAPAAPAAPPGSAPTPMPAPRPGDVRAVDGSDLMRATQAQTGAVPLPAPSGSTNLPAHGPTPGTIADMYRLEHDEAGVARQQALLAGGQVAEAIQRYVAGGGKLTSGAEGVNMNDLNQWVYSHSNPLSYGTQKAFATGQEVALFQQIKAIKDKGGAPATMADVFAASIALNKGDVTKALLTVHNTLRAIARPTDESSTFATITNAFYRGSDEALTEEQRSSVQATRGEAFFREYLDGRSAGIRPPGDREQIADDWYHTAVGALITHVGNERGVKLADFVSGGTASDKRGLGTVSAAATWFAQLFTNAGDFNRELNSWGEQVAHGKVNVLRGRGEGAETIGGQEPGEIMGTMRAQGIAAVLAKALGR